jgi:hypothetical protein
MSGIVTEPEFLGVFDTDSGKQARYRVGSRIVILYTNRTLACTCGSSWHPSKRGSTCREMEAVLTLLKKEGHIR